MDGFFNGKPIEGKRIGNPNNPACSAGALGLSYRADVLKELDVDTVLRVRRGNGSHLVTLPQTASTMTNGATLVLVYRTLVPGQPRFTPLRAVIGYDGASTFPGFSAPMTQNMSGFYQSSANAAAKIVPIVANGQSTTFSTFTVNGVATNPSNAFRGNAGTRWDNPTFPISNLAQDSASYSTQVSVIEPQSCLTFVSMWSSMNGLRWTPGFLGIERIALEYGNCNPTSHVWWLRFRCRFGSPRTVRRPSQLGSQCQPAGHFSGTGLVTRRRS
jgi:hypothetical protein